MAIILLIFKPVMTFLLFNIIKGKRGEPSIGAPTFGDWNPGQNSANAQGAGKYGSYQEQQ
jgi:hypothetical protein